MFAALAGAATIATFAVTIVMGQEYLPGRLGVAAGVTIGLSIGLGGVGAPLLGLLADAHGLRAVFEASRCCRCWRCARAGAAAAHAPATDARSPMAGRPSDASIARQDRRPRGATNSRQDGMSAGASRGG